MLLVQHGALERDEEPRKGRKELDDAEENFGVITVAENKTSNDTKTAEKQDTNFKAKHIIKVGRNCEEVAEMTKQLCQRAFSAATRAKEFVAVIIDWETCKAKDIFLG